MSNKVVIISKDGVEQRRLALDVERALIGRDESCEIPLEDGAVSRKHAALIHRFDAVYVENISPTGKVSKGGAAIEYAELAEGEEVHIGPYVLKWETGDAPAGEPAAPPPPANMELNPAMEAGEAPVVSGLDLADASAAPAPTPSLDAMSADISVSAEGTNMPVPVENPEDVPSDGKTQVVQSTASARLRVAKGEQIGREIKLDQGSTWIVGRSPQCHIKIENQKISRQHFRIVRIQNVFRLQDLGSAHGTRLNGVSVSDAPLQPFDSIQAGPVELQFLLVDANLPAIPSATVSDDGRPLADEKTAFAAPVPFGAGPSPADAGAYVNMQVPPQGATAGSGTVGGVKLNVPGDNGSLFLRAREWYAAQPRPRQMLIITLLVATAATSALFLMPENKPAPPQVTQIQAEPVRAPASKEEGVSDDFMKLSPQKQNEVRDNYGRAERALADKRYKDAFDHARRVLDIVTPYKNATDILDQAQAQLNNDSIGLVSKSLTSVQDARQENQGKLELLIAEGKKALGEKRFSDAAEAFQRALALDPTNAQASQGLAGAIANDASMVVDVPNKPVEVDPEIEEIQEERDAMAALRTQYQGAKSRLNEGNFREALPELRDLENRLGQNIEEFSAGRRAPASIRNELNSESRSLMSQVKEAISLARSQLRIEYQTQFADAEQFTNNRQYVQAREVYDRIVRLEPAFDEPRLLRQKLYVKMIAEARTLYQEALIYESIGDIANAQDGFQRSKELLTNVKDPVAIDYYKKSLTKLKNLNKPQL